MDHSFHKASHKYRKHSKGARKDFRHVKDKALGEGLIRLSKSLNQINTKLNVINKKLDRLKKGHRH
ncbi:hypothetical protein D3C87_209810 [compost metagenome]